MMACAAFSLMLTFAHWPPTTDHRPPITGYRLPATGYRLPAADPSTPEDRAALFDYIYAKTMAREAFSPIKNERLGLDIEREMLRYRDEMIAADTDEKLYYALLKLSNVRKDRHLSIALVPGGISLPNTTGIQMENYPSSEDAIPHAPVRFAVDFGTPDAYFFFLSDYTTDIAQYVPTNPPEIGDALVAINGWPIGEYFQAIEPFHRYSTVNGLWWKAAEWLTQKSFQFPPSFYREDVVYTLQRRSGEEYELALPYVEPASLTWEEHGARTYPGFALAYDAETFNLYRHESKPVLLLSWYGFREFLVEDIDHLVAWAAENDFLHYNLIFDGTRSRGGSKGAYAVQRLSPRRFKTTFGNLRISDVVPAFIEIKQGEFVQGLVEDNSVAETLDDGSRLIDWLSSDVADAARAGRPYSDNVPFKLAHAPKDSDGMLEPARVHFRGDMVGLFSPYGGSHLDQFASILIDNDLAYTIGMPAGGYSNTWEWEETLYFPISGKPVVRYMWSIGHTIRPNGEILEGNPALVDEYVPVTRDNYPRYYPTLIERALTHFGLQ